MKPLKGDQQLRSVSVLCPVCTPGIQNPPDEKEGAWMQTPVRGFTERSGEVFSLDILSHGMSAIV
ncbi:MAG: hypothetical protein WBV41_19925, partial [Terriglobales bacterium]